MVATSRLKVMHLVYALETGGLENGVVNLCNRLSPDVFQPSICVFRSGGALEARVDAQRVELLAVRCQWGIDPTLPVRLAWHLRRRRIDILHTHSWGTLVEGIIAAKLAGTPSIIHGEHGTLEERPRNIRVQHWLWPKASEIVAVAASLADQMSRVIGYPRDRIRVIPNGVDTKLFCPMHEMQDDCRRQFGLPPSGFLIGMVARLDPIKNHLGMLRALVQLNEKGIEANLAIAGDGLLRKELQQAVVDLHVSNQVYFLGDVGRTERLYNALDAFVINSHSEGMSNTILEAMACGIPVVATSVGENPGLVSDGMSGYLIPADDSDALASKLALLAQDPSLRSDMGRAGRLRIEGDFSIERMIREYEDLYRQRL